MKKFELFLLFIWATLATNAQPTQELFTKAQIALEKGQLDESLNLCSQIENIGAIPKNYHSLHGQVYLEKGWHTLAIEEFSKAISANTQEAKNFAMRGFSNFMLKEYKLARADYVRACELDSLNAIYPYNLGKTEQQMYRMKDAIHSYSRALQLNKTYAEAYHERGNVYLSRHDLSKALADFDSALKYKQNDEKILLGRGMTLTSLKRYKEASEMFSRCIRLNEKNSAAYYNRGFVKFQLRDFQNAISDFDLAIKYKPDMELAYFDRALCDLELSGKKHAVACDDFRKAAELGYMEALEYIRKYCE